MPSFDIVSEVDRHELINAVDQARRELTTRFDFRNVEASFEHEARESTKLGTATQARSSGQPPKARRTLSQAPHFGANVAWRAANASRRRWPQGAAGLHSELPSVADALHPLLARGGGAFNHVPDAADDAPVP